MTEEWRNIPDFSRYQVSNQGRIRIAISGAIRKQQITIDGYMRLNLTADDGCRSTPYVHNLVAIAFCDAPPRSGVRHINKNRQDNRAVNLRWVVYRRQS
jgi:hypothetical protein